MWCLQAICFHQFLIVDLVPIDAYRVRRLQKRHRSHRSNSQFFQGILKCNQGFFFFFFFFNFNFIFFYIQQCWIETLSRAWALFKICKTKFSIGQTYLMIGRASQQLASYFCSLTVLEFKQFLMMQSLMKRIEVVSLLWRIRLVGLIQQLFLISWTCQINFLVCNYPKLLGFVLQLFELVIIVLDLDLWDLFCSFYFYI